MSLSQSKRRASGPNRAIQAAYEPYALVLAPSPLIRVDDEGTRAKVVIRSSLSNTTQASSTESFSNQGATKSDADTRSRRPTRRLTEIGPIPCQTIFDFLSHSLRDVVQAASTCRLFRNLSNTSVSRVELIPQLGSCESFSRPRAMESLAAALKPYLRGQHITLFSVVSAKHSLTLQSNQKGPCISAMSLHRAIQNMPNLTHLDVRGVDLKDYSPWKDHFLSDLSRITPQLKCLKVGGAFLRNWEPLWWSKLNLLTDFVVGSRREDADWHDPQPVNLHDDFFHMLRSHKWQSIKVWVVLSLQSVTQLLLPSAAFPDLVHLSINLSGSAATLKVSDDVPVTESAPTDKKKPDPKAVKKPDEQSHGRFLFPTLATVCLADISDRPDVATDLMQRFLLTAPAFQALNIVNTHRNAPGRVPAQSKTRWSSGQ
jgi:hypothetical protein